MQIVKCFVETMRSVEENFDKYIYILIFVVELLVIWTDLHNIQSDAIKTSQFTQLVSMFVKVE